MTLNELTDISSVYQRNGFHKHETRLLIPVSNNYQDRFFRSARRPLMPPERCHTTKVCSLQGINQSNQAVDTVLVSLGVAHLAQHPVRSNPGDPDLHGEAQGRQTAIVADHQIDGQKPLHQGQIGGIKGGASHHRCLASALVALVELTRRYPVALIVPTIQALKTIGPALSFPFSYCLHLITDIFLRLDWRLP